MNHKDLDCWKESIKLVKELYQLVISFPDEKKIGITNQIKRAAVSIPTNISKGASINSSKEYIHFFVYFSWVTFRN